MNRVKLQKALVLFYKSRIMSTIYIFDDKNHAYCIDYQWGFDFVFYLSTNCVSFHHVLNNCYGLDTRYDLLFYELFHQKYLFLLRIYRSVKFDCHSSYRVRKPFGTNPLPPAPDISSFSSAPVQNHPFSYLHYFEITAKILI